eukprot:CAMPEP_0115723504 /NCGR_PEP_ID=MMETSP0272-20121206/80271_1 /TAXON_ID=71861 /ORGANISM="Scrippsiella trochoidea, Strain CCMP3099" /LENGTH=77 /DNA_ID=CAMNT_0003166647 /DNA_START=12 /DNA_END=246 /DNA_ORIENTATION=+
MTTLETWVMTTQATPIQRVPRNGLRAGWLAANIAKGELRNDLRALVSPQDALRNVGLGKLLPVAQQAHPKGAMPVGV